MCFLIGLDADFTALTSTFLDLSALLLEDGRLFGCKGENQLITRRNIVYTRTEDISLSSEMDFFFKN